MQKGSELSSIAKDKASVLGEQAGDLAGNVKVKTKDSLDKAHDVSDTVLESFKNKQVIYLIVSKKQLKT